MKHKFKLVSSTLTFILLTGLPQAASGNQVNDPIKWADNGNYYHLVLSATPLAWNDAKNQAEAAKFEGRSGHLATVTSQGENDFIKTLADGNLVWLGGKLQSVRNPNATYSASWYWASGPENGTPFSPCAQSTLPSCQASFSNWDDSSPTVQPDMRGGEDSLVMFGEHPQTTRPGSWHDCPNSGGGCSIYGYVIEFESNSRSFIQASSNLGFQGYQGRVEANLDLTDNHLLVSGISGSGKVSFLNPATLAVEKEVIVPTSGTHFTYPLVSGADIFLSNSFGLSGTWIRKYDSESETFGAATEVCSVAGYDKGIASGGLLYIPCTDQLVIVNSSNMEIVQTLVFTGRAVQPAVSKEHIWVPIHDGSLLKFGIDSGNLIQEIPNCSNSQSVHIVGDKLVCLELNKAKVFDLAGELLGDASLPDGLSSYYRSQDETGIWISNLSQNIISHFNADIIGIDKIVTMSGYTSGSAVFQSATYVATGDGKINRIGLYPASANSNLLTFEANDTLGAGVVGDSAAPTKLQGSFSGTVTTIEDAPAGGNGGKALKIVKNGEPYAGVNVLAFEAATVRVTNAAHTAVTFNYYSPKADSPVRIELRGHPNALGKTVIAPLGWSMITVDFADVPGWTSTEEFVKVILFPDFEVAAAGDVFFIDNIAFNGATTPAIPVVSVPREATSTLLTFETGDALGAKVVGDSTLVKPEGGFEGAVTTVDVAPALGNGGKALKIVKGVGAPTYAGVNVIRFGADKRVTNGTYKTITFNYYSPKTTSNVRVELRAFPNALGKTVAAPKGWSKITVDFTDVAGWTSTEEFVSVIMFPDFDVAGAGHAFYVDNLAFNGATTPAIPAPKVKPAVKTAATVSGTAKVAKTLTAGKGSWTGTATIAYTYKWYRCSVSSTKTATTAPTSSAKCATISGATKSTYKLTKSDIGQYIRVLVAAKNVAGTAYSMSKTSSTKVVK
jgi:hypothetical protein